MSVVPKSEPGFSFQHLNSKQAPPQINSFQSANWYQQQQLLQQHRQQLEPSLNLARRGDNDETRATVDMVVQLSQSNFQRHANDIRKLPTAMHSQQVPSAAMLVDSNGLSDGGNGIDNSPGSSTASNADLSASGGSAGNGGANGDAEGVWSPDIDQAFHEALQIYPPCGRRKIILSDEGKMYGRNELIARYIKIRCGKTRTRKQVSSHIQVLARKKQREVHSKVKVQDSKYGPNDFDCGDDTLNLGAEYSSSAQVRISASGASSPASSCLDIVATTSATDAIAPNSVPKKEIHTVKLEATSGAIDTLTSRQGDHLLSTINNSELTLPFAHSAPSTTAAATSAAAALAAVAAASGASSSVMRGTENGHAADGSWPCGVTPSAFNNYYAASMINDENIYQQFRAAALAAGVSLAPTTASGMEGICSNVVAGSAFGTSPTDFLQQLQIQQQQLNLQQQQLSAAQQQRQHVSYMDDQPMVGPPNGPLSLADCMVASSKLVLCGFTAYIEQSDERRVELVKIPSISDEPLENIKMEDIQYKYPQILQDLFEAGPPDAFFLAKCWANVSFDMADIERAALYSVDSFYNSRRNFDISVSTKVCSFGKQVVEKVEVYSPVVDDDENNGANCTRNMSANLSAAVKKDIYEFRLEKSPMCDYMVRFIAELKKLDSAELMNSVLDNFTVLQIVTNKANDETLMVIAFIFEVSPEPESTCRMYRLVA